MRSTLDSRHQKDESGAVPLDARARHTCGRGTS